MTYDAMIIGGRVAGSAAAILLKRQGLKVLLIDKSSGPTDVISTHFMNPRGMTYLKAVGVLDPILDRTPAFHDFDVRTEEFDLGGKLIATDLEARLGICHPGIPFELETRYACIRRTLLDDVLQKRAREEGVEFRIKTSLTDLILEDGRVVGASIESNGIREAVRAQAIIGADGRHSRVAEILQIPKTEERKHCTFACYSYFKGLNLKSGIMRKKGRLTVAAVPTSDGNTMVLVFGPDSFYEDFRKNREANFYLAIDRVDPNLGRSITPEKRVEPFRLTVEQAGFMRLSKNGVALIGDAAISKDQCTASGMAHALRDAFLLSDELRKAFKGIKPFDQALADFSDRRYLDSFRFYEFTMQQAEMNPLRPEERELYEAISSSQIERDRFIGLYFDCVGAREFFKADRIDSLLRNLSHRERITPPAALSATYQNPFSHEFPILSLEQTCVDYGQPFGKNILDRNRPYLEFYNRRETTGTFQYERMLHRFPGNITRLSDRSGRVVDGINFASQDYLGLGQHPAIAEAAQRALVTFGPHSAGSPMIIGNTTLTRELEDELSQLTGKTHVVIFPTGYAAGMGGILGIVRPQDSIVMDRLSHACLQQGARAATKHVYRYAHLNPDAARAELKRIRARDKRNAILLLTEGLFSMDADSPDLKKFQELAHEYEATLFVDVAHDLGAMGSHGRGQMGLQNMYGKIDIVMGSFSKSFASNGGFVASDSESLAQYLKMYSTAHLFSNALSPIQTAVALECAKIMQTHEGERLREQLMEVVLTLRAELTSHELDVIGNPSPIVPVMIGTERNARLCHRAMMEKNIATMIIEYPVVPLSMARFRLQVMASHTHEQARTTAATIAEVMCGSEIPAVARQHETEPSHHAAVS